MTLDIGNRTSKPVNHRVLAIDDSPETIDAIRAALGAGFQLLAATNGRVGLEIARKQLPELILLDVLMPEMDGYEVCRQLKADALTRDIPVIFLSGLDSEVDEIRGFSAGGVDFVTKPMEPVILKVRVRTQIELANARKALAQANDFMEDEREIMAEILLAMRNDKDFCNDNLSYACHSRDTAGGDVLLSAKRSNGDHHFLVGDFTGHGLTAAIGTPLVSHLFYAMTAADIPLSTIVRDINNVLARRLPSHIFMAAAAVCLSEDNRRAELWSFGNPEILYRGASRQWVRYASLEMPMGIVAQDDLFASIHLDFEEDGNLYVFTDGPIEVVCRDGSYYGVDRLIEAIDRYEQSLDSVIADVIASAEQPNALDDLTLLRIGRDRQAGPRNSEIEAVQRRASSC